ncbi:hypothetical protein ABRZ04_07485 [Castellaniella ginsengisoli]|uniref:Uncharacterized protein n=1 Tax=Castellaniella ginsengisoli TaxID=546114 RepID=A0AB39CVG7_9BURK
MTKKEITQPDTARKNRPYSGQESPPLCPRCGEPLPACDCANRWENEGGATAPLRKRKDSG